MHATFRQQRHQDAVNNNMTHTNYNTRSYNCSLQDPAAAPPTPTIQRQRQNSYNKIPPVHTTTSCVPTNRAHHTGSPTNNKIPHRPNTNRSRYTRIPTSSHTVQHLCGTSGIDTRNRNTLIIHCRNHTHPHKCAHNCGTHAHQPTRKFYNAARSTRSGTSALPHRPTQYNTRVRHMYRNK